MKADTYQIVTDRIMAKLEAGTIPWKHFASSPLAHPRNLVSKKPYRGINHFLLSGSQYNSPYWLTLMKSPSRAGLYARVSTIDQQTLPLQIADMRQYAERRGWTVVKEVQDINGGTKQRPKREELIQMAKRRHLDVIVVWRLDRWGRSLGDVVHSLEELRAIKVDFASVTEGLDFSTPTGRAMGQMLGIFAEFEREVLRDRVRAGLAHAKAKGKTLGRPTTARDKAQEIEQLFAAGVSKKQIAARLGIGRASVFRVLEKAL